MSSQLQKLAPIIQISKMVDSQKLKPFQSRKVLDHNALPVKKFNVRCLSDVLLN
jgi:hypothetical protein